MGFGDSDELTDREYSHADLSDQITELREFTAARFEGLAAVEQACTEEVNEQRERCRISYMQMQLARAVERFAVVATICFTVYICVHMLTHASGAK